MYLAGGTFEEEIPRDILQISRCVDTGLYFYYPCFSFGVVSWVNKLFYAPLHSLGMGNTYTLRWRFGAICSSLRYGRPGEFRGRNDVRVKFSKLDLPQ